MKHAKLLPVAAILAVLGVQDALAEDRRGNRGHERRVERHGGHRDHVRHDRRDHRAHRHHGDRHWHGSRHFGHRLRHHHHRYWAGWHGPRYYWSTPHYWGPRYYWDPYPRWLYRPAYPVYYSVPAYEPVIVERYVERVYEPAPPRREERYAQAPRPIEPSPPAATTPRIDRVTLSATELFEFDKATLRQPQPRLDEIARMMNANPQIGTVTITGYTDRLGSDEYNLKLSQRRADAVKAYLVSKGVAASRLRAVGRGEADPVVQCGEKDRAALIKCLEPNRRVEVESITVEQRRDRPQSPTARGRT